MKSLFIGCHCDDIEIGCGGTIHHFKEEWDIQCLTLSEINPQGVNLRDTQRDSLKCLGASFVRHEKMETRKFSESRQLLWQLLSQAKTTVSPQIVFVNSSDKHQDHKALFDEALRVFTDCSLVSYNVYGVCSSNMVVSLNEEDMKAKLRSMKHYEKHYSGKPYLDPSKVESILRANCLSHEFSEVFQIHRWCL